MEKEQFNGETLKTLDSLGQEYKNFSQSGSKKCNAKDFYLIYIDIHYTFLNEFWNRFMVSKNSSYAEYF